MPTARELLEQADALMRRNRLGSTSADDGIPVLTDEVPPSTSRTDEPVVAAPAPAPASVPSPAPVTDLEDVPLLTDAVEEIDAPSILETPEEDTGADAWTDTLTGSYPTQGGPPIAGEEATASAPALPSVESIDIAPPPEEPASVERAWYDPSEKAMPPPPPAEALPLPSADVLPMPTADVVPLHAPAAPIAGTVEPVAAHEAPPLAPPETPPPETPPPETPPGETPPSEAKPVSSPASDDARWAQLAEEVRMQVLQRIDLFTDTGLRDQLAARLQPIVDRASADLVATINQHVGVLLRAYVAEAIEREIERWRDQSR
jgi:hypothetical protein